jgi:hypothetical protein
MDLVLRAVMAWNKPWKGQDLEHVEDITRATLGTGLTSSNERLSASRLLDFGPYLFSDPSHTVFFEPEEIHATSVRYLKIWRSF